MIDTLFSSKDSTMCVVVDAIMGMTMLMVMSSMMWGGGNQSQEPGGEEASLWPCCSKALWLQNDNKGGKSDTVYRGMSPEQKYFSFTAHSIYSKDDSRFRAHLNQQYNCESKYRPVVSGCPQ